jgi:hypothetical protein
MLKRIALSEANVPLTRGRECRVKRALESIPTRHQLISSCRCCLFRGELPEALRLVLEAEKLDPVPITSYVATAAYLANDRIDDAISEGQRTLQLDPELLLSDSNLAAASRQGQLPEDRALH